MNSPFFKIISVVASAFGFTLLLYKQHIGLNLLLFEVFIICMLASAKRIEPTKEVLLCLIGTLISAVMIMVHNSVLSIFINLVSLFLFIGTILLPVARSLPHSFAYSIVHSVLSQIEFLRQLNGTGKSNARVSVLWKWLRILIIPLFVVLIFVVIYSNANPVFEGMLEGITEQIDAVILWFSKLIEPALFFFFLFGMLVSDFLLLKTTEKNLERSALSTTDQLQRRKSRISGPTLDLGLKHELRSGIILVAFLNLLLLLINCIDIYWVWFNFEWDGDYLKQFVHEGTSLLIISILISIAIGMYLFRGNQNFYSKSKILQTLTLAWLLQNAVLAISVGIRNAHYIEYYALAHKRIGVFFFLLATLVGLAIVMYKIRHRKTVHYVLRTNAISVYSILIVMTLVNWDVLIAKYNFKHYETTFTHLDFLARLSDAALPHQKFDLDFLKAVEESNAAFPSEVRYLTAEEYSEQIHNQTSVFLQDWQERDWRSWNWAYQRAYNELNKQKN